MKITENKTFLATIALIIAAIIGGLAALGSKVALRELPPLTVLFLRLTNGWNCCSRMDRLRFLNAFF